jgi:hypothetical protein
MLEAGVRSSDYTFEFSRYIQAGSNSGSRDNDCMCLGTDVLWVTDPIILTIYSWIFYFILTTLMQ